MNSPRLLDILTVVEALHSNFYEGMFDLDHVTYQAEQVRQVVEALLEQVPEQES